MFTKLVNRTAVLATLLGLLAVPALGQDLSERSDRQLQLDLREVERDIRDLERYATKLQRAGRSSSNADRNSAVEKILDHMTDILHDREDQVGQEHTIIRHGSMVKSGLTDAAEVGTPIGRKETRRRLKRGTEENLSGEVMRLVRMRAAVVSAGLLERTAIEKQADSFERFQRLAREFGTVLEEEAQLIRVEMDHRSGIYVEPDSVTANPGTP
ncbi:MAG: hypothetical protein GY838_11445 [bacterium]|nr:hypothetical protein [bacterium]